MMPSPSTAGPLILKWEMRLMWINCLERGRRTRRRRFVAVRSKLQSERSRAPAFCFDPSRSRPPPSTPDYQLGLRPLQPSPGAAAGRTHSWTVLRRAKRAMCERTRRQNCERTCSTCHVHGPRATSATSSTWGPQRAGGHWPRPARRHFAIGKPGSGISSPCKNCASQTEIKNARSSGSEKEAVAAYIHIYMRVPLQLALHSAANLAGNM